MAFSLIWLPEVLRNAGLKVAETDGWANRGRAAMGTVRGVMCHHTGSSGAGNMPTLQTLKVGRSGLPGPLAQLGLGRDGTFYVVAAGRANHAGGGNWKGITTGNSSFIGIEAENRGRSGDNWPDVQMDAYRRGVAAMLKHMGANADMCCGHKEYAKPDGRKPDPLFDMNKFRAEVRDIMRGVGIIRPLIPAADPVTGKPTLKRGSHGDDVRIIQKKVGVADDGRFGPGTEAAVRRFQRLNPPLVDDGIVGPKTWRLIIP
ncbi:N-acetylmuramoyl-L-alanine amidase [Mesorhizobium sp. BR1-1-6]|uniref:peptidoglycan recognition protein family protein n=1 Tax=Mesorhizobium sp. BR1-1-6 TaxID=2876648 RepID=UPI001CD11DC9|nr:peptidoglycan-binding domain-containing protein [Mesorhizobium sp. BR1-1-6]MBZ9898545.1 N-acetylmuramoyl-L-alanine amidase [Mesorhizobium sp. BR1-1-6]